MLFSIPPAFKTVDTFHIVVIIICIIVVSISLDHFSMIFVFVKFITMFYYNFFLQKLLNYVNLKSSNLQTTGK